MASIISYVGRFLPRQNRSGYPEAEVAESGMTCPAPSETDVCWNINKSYLENLERFDPVTQLRSLADQVIAAAYYRSFYGVNCMCLVDDYFKDIQILWNSKLCSCYMRTFNENEALKNVVKNVCYLMVYVESGTLKERVNIDVIDLFFKTYVPNQEVPYVFHDESYLAYLAWLNKWFGFLTSGFNEVNATTSKCIGLTGFEFCMVGGCEEESVHRGYLSLRSVQYPIGTSFSQRDPSLNIAIDQLRSLPLLHYLAHFRMNRVRKVEELMGILGGMCLTLDTDRKDLISSQRLAAQIKGAMSGRISVLTACGVATASQNCWCRNLFEPTKKFVEIITTTYGVTMEDRELIARLFNCVSETKEQKDSASYIRERGGSASAEHRESFNKVLGSLEALQFISQNDTLASSMSQDAKSVVAAADDGTENKESEGEDSKDKSDQETSTSESGKDDAEDDSSAEDDPSEGEDDTSGEDETKDDNPDETENKDESTDDASGDASTSSDENDMPSDDDDTPNTSDAKGFKFKVANADNETTDSVLFREELDNYLSTVLANPPEDLSPQDVQTLTALQRYWLHLLSIKTILGIVGSCLKQLPKSLTKLLTE